MRERLHIWWYGVRLDIRMYRRDGFWRWVAHKLPKRVVYFALMRAYADVWADAKTIEPHEIDFERNTKYWQHKAGLDRAA